MKTRVKLREHDEWVSVDLTPLPILEKETYDEWQEILNEMIHFYHVSAALIMKLNKDDLEVLVASTNEDNPYEIHDKAMLGLGHYCETVIGAGQPLIVEDARHDEHWFDNPDIALNMIHYYGLPLHGPSGEKFGTLCLLHFDPRTYTETEINVFNMFCGMVEQDLLIMKSHETLSKHYDELNKTISLILSYEKSQQTDEIIANISDDIVTPLGVALTTASFMNHMINTKSPLPIEKIHEASGMIKKHMLEATDMLRAFQKMNDEVEVLEMIDLVDSIQLIVDDMKAEVMKHGIKIALHPITQPKMYMNITFLSHIMIHLIKNCMHHAFDSIEDKRIDIHVLTLENNVHIQVVDNGNGMLDETRDIFEPFVTTNSEDNVGLGLAVVREIVELKLNGFIDYETSEQGTIFTIQLPLEGRYEKH